MLTYKWHNNIAPTYLSELINRRESSVNTRLGAEHQQLIMPPIVRIVQTLFLNVHSFMPLHANGTNWVNVLERQIVIVSGRVLKQCYLHNNMKMTKNNNVSIIAIFVVITVNYCK